MLWKKISDAVEMWEKPALGTIGQKDGKKYMALCIDPGSKNPYRGIARQVTERIGNVNIEGYVDKSKLIIVESQNLLTWKVIKDLSITGIDSIVKKILMGQEKEKEFLGLEDSDILVDEKGLKHVFFTIAFKYKNKIKYDAHLGHAVGKYLDNLKALSPVLEAINNNILGFKELCPVPIVRNGKKLALTETRVENNKEHYWGISVSEIKELSEKWKYLKVLHNPKQEEKSWCSGGSSPCRIFNPSVLRHKKYLVGIMNGREQSETIKGKKHLGKFRPGLFLLDSKKLEIPWIADKPLLEDNDSTGITFASELIQLNKREVLLYVHVNDSFVRVYKLNLDKIKEMLPEEI